jgi:hypothetical protein
MSFRRGISNVLAIAFLAPGIIGGCNTTVVPPAEAALQGSWVMDAPNSNEHDGKIFVFDDVGHLTEIRKITGNTTFVDKDAHKETTVNGQSVRIVTASDLIFEGTFDETMTVINGNLQSEFTIFFTNDVVITDLGPATLTKQ